ncbi:MAG: alpha/beta hydrolase [Candidatus Paceibacterota bacterium]|jgi:hypothetical protein
MKQQILVIHGGDNFATYKKYLSFLKKFRIDFEYYKSDRKSWKRNLTKNLGRNYEVILPEMPNKFNAKYLEWKIWFEKLIPYIKPKAIFVGHSLGGTFLVKYLSENKFSKNIKATFLVAACFNSDGLDDPLLDFEPPKNISSFKDQAGQIFIYHSQDDKVVPVSHAKKFQKVLPKAKLTILKNRGHFNQEKIPELIKDLKNKK